MHPEDVKHYIKHYKECVVRCLHLKTEIDELKTILERIDKAKVADLISITQKWDIMPHGTGVGDPTGTAAEKICDGDRTLYAKQIEKEIENKKEELQKRTAMISYVDAWLQILSEREKFVIQSRCIDGILWGEVEEGFFQTFGLRYSQQGLKRILNRGIEKICAIAK